MANPYINIYKNNPTAGATDGTAVSTNGDNTSPIEFDLNAEQNESASVKLAIRTESGYVTSGITSISDLNDTNDRLKLSWTANGPFSDTITTNNSISSINTIFYAQASSSSSENPQTDRSASFLVNCIISSV